MATFSPRYMIRTATGVVIPRLIYNTEKLENKTTRLVIQAVRAGFRGIDTDCQAKNCREDLVGEAIKRLDMEHGVKREQLYLQSKFTAADQKPDPQSTAPLREQVRQSFAKSLANLCTSYVDSLLVNGPWTHSHAATMEVWRALEELHNQGQVKQLGLSRLHDAQQLAKLYEEARVKPAVIQNLFSANTGYDAEVRRFCRENAIVYRSDMDPRNPRNNSNAIHVLSNKRGITYPQLYLRLLLDLGFALVAGPLAVEHMKADLDVLDLPPLLQYELTVVKREIGIS